MHKIKVDNIHISLPEKVEELTLKDLAAFLFAYSQNWSFGEKSFYFLSQKVPLNTYKKIKALTETQLAQLLNCLSWIEEDIKPEAILKYFDFGGKRYFAPQTEMSSSTCVEYFYADAYAMTLEDNPKAINHVVAALYREKDSAKEIGDIRQRFDPDRVGEAAKEFEKLSEAVKISALLFFVAVKKKVADDYAEAFEADDQSVEGTWIDTLLTVAESKVFGSFEEVKYAYFHEVMMYLVKKKKEYHAWKIKNQLSRA